MIWSGLGGNRSRVVFAAGRAVPSDDSVFNGWCKIDLTTGKWAPISPHLSVKNGCRSVTNTGFGPFGEVYLCGWGPPEFPCNTVKSGSLGWVGRRTELRWVAQGARGLPKIVL